MATINSVGIALSGGASNTNPAASLGGQPNFTQRLGFFSATLNKLFPDVTKVQSQNGITQHRCLYLWCDGHTGSGSGPGTWSDVRLFVIQKHPEALDQIWIGNGSAPASNKKSDGFAWEPDIDNESNAPHFVTFTSHTVADDYETGIKLGNIPGDPNGPWFKSFWVKRVVTAGSLSIKNAYFSIVARGKIQP